MENINQPQQEKNKQKKEKEKEKEKENENENEKEKEKEITKKDRKKTKHLNKDENKKTKKKENKNKGKKRKIQKGVGKEASELPMLRLKCTTGKLFPVKPSSGRWNAMVITDCHFNNTKESWFSTRLIPKTMKKLGELIKSEGVDQLITLGDIFHSKCKSDEYVVQIVKQMADFGVELFMIGGNHDRGKTSRLTKLLPKKYRKKIHIVKNYFMGCLPSNPNEEEIDVVSESKIFDRTYPRVVFAHDAGNNYKLSGKEVVLFLRAIRFGHGWFEDSDLFVTGHTHRNRWFNSENMGSLTPFHMGHFGKVTYGVLKETESGGALKWNVFGFYHMFL
ncbi:component of atp-dependent dsDNA exonuclease [Anaeramoeba flamelloides]|uniref:Component of atp-dependent dsDNA exonuclease n=1 Tax=Anaeramoeba flamelloides TaxID=1746091 RepID=A0ABQ8Z4V6_9EUKA|nr:component of atp-dependent dsDNA exonuclease [Anaeramoeba flamelloides]